MPQKNKSCCLKTIVYGESGLETQWRLWRTSLVCTKTKVYGYCGVVKLRRNLLKLKYKSCCAKTRVNVYFGVVNHWDEIFSNWNCLVLPLFTLVSSSSFQSHQCCRDLKPIDSAVNDIILFHKQLMMKCDSVYSNSKWNEIR